MPRSNKNKGAIGPGEGPMMCQQCGVWLKTHDELKAHELEYHERKRKGYLCPYCKMGKVLKAEMYQHL